MKIDGKQKHRIKIGGTFSFNKLSNEQKTAIFNRLAEKDPVIKSALEGNIPGIKIDGKIVTRESIKKLEKSNKVDNGKLIKAGTLAELEMKKVSVPEVSVPEKKEEVKKSVQKKIMSKGEVYAMSKKEQTEMIKSFGERNVPRLEKNRVKKILELQSQ